MDICTSLDNVKIFNQSVLTIGIFDGIHLGHQKLFNKLNKSAKLYQAQSVIITFNPHPREILDKGFICNTITPLENKINLFKKMEIDNLVIIPFDKKFSLISGKTFIQSIIAEKFRPKEIIIGFNHHFGHNRSGSNLLLSQLKETYNYKLQVINPYICDGTIVSSSAIRNYIKTGNVSMANKMLGKSFKMDGKVIKGEGRGRKLQFPTANVELIYINQIKPNKGVYLVRVLIDGISYKGMCNIGTCPTFNSYNKESIEVHIFDLDCADLYGRKIELFFEKYIRDEKKFNSEQQLTEQLILDKEFCIMGENNKE